MQAVILAGGLGTRLTEETQLRPKPMVEIGGRPILWHIMKSYSYHGINDFIICCGYKGYVIKEYFSNYFLHMSDVTINIEENSMAVHHKRAEPWKITLVDTGENTMTGGRLLRVKSYLDANSVFCLTYGDGVGDIDISKAIEFHKTHGKLATMTATYPPGRFGSIEIQNGCVSKFEEKIKGDGSLINAGYFVLNPGIFSYLDDDSSVWEREPLEKMCRDGELMAFEHQGFWQPMDTLRDKVNLDSLWNDGRAPWKLWND